MRPQISKSGKLRTILWAVLASIPIWIIFCLDTLLFLDKLERRLIPGEFYLPGFLLYGALGLPRDYDSRIVLLLTCIAYFLIIWLIVYIIFRIRRRRKIEG